MIGAGSVRGDAAGRLGELDALRGLAAFGVAFFFHFVHFSGKAEGPLAGFPAADWLYRYGWTLVDLFFVISGFIFSHVYLSSLRLRDGISARIFFIKRISRLYPLHIATLVISAVLVSLTVLQNRSPLYPWNDVRHFLLNIFFAQKIGLEWGYSFNGPSWSISIEVLCYILFFLAARFSGRFFMVTVLLLCGLGIAMAAQGVFFSVSRGLTGFFMGCMLHSAMPWVRHLPTWLLACLALGSLYVLARSTPLENLIGYAPQTSLLVWPVLIALSFRGWIAQMLRLPPLQWLGDLSYAIYLLHVPVQMALLLWLGETPYFSRDSWPAVFLINMAITLSLAQLSYRWFETPCRRYLNRYARPSGGSSRPSAARA